MRDLRHKVLDWINDDFWNGHGEHYEESALVKYLIENHENCFRVKAKRLCRKLIEEKTDEKGKLKAKKELIDFLRQELPKGSRIKLLKDIKRIEPEVQAGGKVTDLSEVSYQENALGRLLHADFIKETNFKRRNSWNPFKVGDTVKTIKNNVSDYFSYLCKEEDYVISKIDEGLLVDLVDDTLLLKYPEGIYSNYANGKKGHPNPIEVCFELLEDLRRGESVLGGTNCKSVYSFLDSQGTLQFKKLFSSLKANNKKFDIDVEKYKKCFKSVDFGAVGVNLKQTDAWSVIEVLAVREARAKLADYGYDAREMKLNVESGRVESVDLSLVQSYLEYLDLENYNNIAKDLKRLYIETKGAPSYDSLFVPIIIDNNTGAGVFLMGKNRLQKAVGIIEKTEKNTEKRNDSSEANPIRQNMYSHLKAMKDRNYYTTIVLMSAYSNAVGLFDTWYISYIRLDISLDRAIELCIKKYKYQIDADLYAIRCENQGDPSIARFEEYFKSMLVEE